MSMLFSQKLASQTLLGCLVGLGISTMAVAAPATPAERDARITAHFQQADTNRDGKLSFEEFKTMRDQQHAEHMERRDDRAEDRRERVAERMQEHFTQADTNRDGQISKAEAQAEMPRLFAKFDQIDSNKDGQLSKAEIAAGHPHHR